MRKTQNNLKVNAGKPNTVITKTGTNNADITGSI